MGEKRSHQHLQLLNSEGNENITVELLLFVDSLLTSERMESQAGQTGGAYQKLLDVSHDIHLHNSALLEHKLPCIRDVVCLQAEDGRLWDNYVSWILWDPVTQRTENPWLISSIFLKDHHTPLWSSQGQGARTELFVCCSAPQYKSILTAQLGHRAATLQTDHKYILCIKVLSVALANKSIAAAWLEKL